MDKACDGRIKTNLCCPYKAKFWVMPACACFQRKMSCPSHLSQIVLKMTKDRCAHDTRDRVVVKNLAV